MYSEPRVIAGKGRARPYASHVARMFVDYAEARELDGNALVRTLDVQLDDEATVELPFATLLALCDRVAALAGDPYVGLSIASALPRGAYGVVEYVASCAATVGDAVQILVKFQALASELARTAIVKDPAAGTVTFQHWVDHPLGASSPHVNELAIATYRRIGELRLGFMPSFREIHFVHDRPDRRAHLEAHFGAPVRFGMPRNALVIEKELLATPMGDADPRLFEILTERAERDLARVVPATQLAAQVATTYRRLLIAAPNRAQAADVAEALGTSVRSLNRGLAEEDTSFRVIEADVKRVLANEYLEDRSRSLDDVATALGFASANAFIRAYKRWTGLTPARART